MQDGHNRLAARPSSLASPVRNRQTPYRDGGTGRAETLADRQASARGPAAARDRRGAINGGGHRADRAAVRGPRFAAPADGPADLRATEAARIWSLRAVSAGSGLEAVPGAATNPP